MARKTKKKAPAKKKTPKVRKPAKEIHRPTEEEEQDRFDLAVELLVAGHQKGRIKIRFREAFDVAPRTCEKYLARAREALQLQASASRADMRAELYHGYRETIRDAGHQDRNTARKGIRELYGLDAPTRERLEVSGQVSVLDALGDPTSLALVQKLKKRETVLAKRKMNGA